MLASLHSVGLLDALLIAVLEDALKCLDFLNVFVATDDVFKVLEQSCLVLVKRFRSHKRDLLDLTLKDQEAIVIQIDAFVLEQGHDGLVVADDIVQKVLGLAGAIDLSRDCELAALDHIIKVRIVLDVHDLLE